MGCMSNLRISLTINFIWAVLILFWTNASEVMSKCGLLRYYFAALIVLRYTSLSLASRARRRVYVSCMRDYKCWAVTIALICATYPQGVMNDDNILGSLKIFWLSVMGSLGLRSYPYPWAKTHLTPIVHEPVVCQCRQSVVLYFWLNAGFILL